MEKRMRQNVFRELGPWARSTLATGVALSALCSTAALGQDGVADVIYFNANVITVDDDFSKAEAVAIDGDRFLAVGKTADVLETGDRDTRLVDLGGRTVTPGFADNHLHTGGGGPGVDLSRARSVSEVLDAIAERVRSAEPGEIITTNSDWHEAQLAEQRLPLRRDLDAVAPDNPVVVVRGGHEYILNSAALQKWEITTETPVPEGGRITRYPDGDLNGELVDAAKRYVSLPKPEEPDLEGRIEKKLAELEKLKAVGLTTIRHPGAPVEQYRLYQELKRRGLLDIRVTQLIRMNWAITPEEVAETIASWDLEPDEGDALLQIGGIKLGVDGGFEGGFMREPYEPPYDQGGDFRGLQIIPQEQFDGVVKEINKTDWRVFTHAVGDAAIDQVLAGYSAADAERSLAGRRWGIEHAFIAREDHFDIIKDLGIYISAQNHLYLAGPSLVKYWGKERASYTTPVKAMLEAGVPVSGGTDSPVVPYPPIWVFYHFATRDTISGGVMGADQAISREDALRLITINNHYLTFEEDEKGSIEPGKYADLVVLDRDLMTAPADMLADTKVLLTVVGGKEVYKDPRYTGKARGNI